MNEVNGQLVTLGVALVTFAVFTCSCCYYVKEMNRLAVTLLFTSLIMAMFL